MNLNSEEKLQARQSALQAYYAEMEAYPEFKILDTLVQRPDALAVNAVQQIVDLTAVVAASNGSDSLGVHPWHTFTSLIEIAKRTAPVQQRKLVECVTQLQKVKVTDQATGKPLTHEGYLVWTELPSLGYTAADEWGAFGKDMPIYPSYHGSEFSNQMYPDTSATNITSQERQRWENMIALIAQLSAAAEVDYSSPIVGEMDFSFWSLRAFKEAFDLEGGQQVPTEIALRTACLWCVYSADRLWANIKNGRVFGQRGDDPGTKMTHEMWHTWERGLLAAQITCTDEETKTLVDDALTHMKRASMESLP